MFVSYVYYECTDKEVTNGTITVNIKYGVVPYYSDSINLCDALPLKCPVEAGQGNMILKNPIPRYKSPVS